MTLLVATPASWAITVVRVTLGTIFFAHGSQKVFGWFGGYGLKGTIGYLTSTGLSLPLAYAVCFFELLGGLGLLFGLLTGWRRRPCSSSWWAASPRCMGGMGSSSTGNWRRARGTASKRISRTPRWRSRAFWPAEVFFPSTGCSSDSAVPTGRQMRRALGTSAKSWA